MIVENFYCRLFFFLSLSTFLFCSETIAADENCLVQGEHEAVTYLLVDRTDKLENTENLKQSLIVARKMIEGGERLVIGVSTGKASETRVLMDYVKPKKSVWTSKLKSRADLKKFDSCIQKTEQIVSQQTEEHKYSALLETLGVVAKVLKSDSAPSKRIIIFSDMIQNSPSVSFYKKGSIRPETLLKQVEEEYLLADFKGVSVYVSGIGSGTSDKKSRMIEQFWNQYFTQTGAELKFYGPVLFS